MNDESEVKNVLFEEFLFLNIFYEIRHVRRCSFMTFKVDILNLKSFDYETLENIVNSETSFDFLICVSVDDGEFNDDTIIVKYNEEKNQL